MFIDAIIKFEPLSWLPAAPTLLMHTKSRDFFLLPAMQAIHRASSNFSGGAILWWREKMHNASTAADCAEMQRLSKIGCFLHFG
ncbi:MAG: hypothetical protein FWC50_06875, partial [Planctomycetaceae bacterium]|nr:hypothetical protein [Planctomycetaceae bacterium]